MTQSEAILAVASVAPRRLEALLGDCPGLLAEVTERHLEPARNYFAFCLPISRATATSTTDLPFIFIHLQIHQQNAILARWHTVIEDQP
jgi:hypothetical protein